MHLFKKNRKLSDGIMGLAIGDALGVPVEFKSREELSRNPVTTMQEYGTHYQPKGTWSDDTSLTMCLVESLLNGYNLKDVAQKFVNWMEYGYWTPYGEVFDIGFQTRKSIQNLKNILDKGDIDDLELLKYETDEHTNGNGALMRMLPLYAYIKDFEDQKQFEIIRDVAALTHGHIRSAIACFMYLKMIHHLMLGDKKEVAYDKTKANTNIFFKQQNISKNETQHFDKFLKDIHQLKENDINSSGYVIDTLEASFWCFLTTNSYKECVLKAVNLGEDTDTTGAVAGGLAGVYYGIKNIPKDWKRDLVAFELILKKSKTLTRFFGLF